MIPLHNEKTPAGGPGSIEVRAGKASDDKVTTLTVDLEQAAQHLGVLAPNGTRFHFRMFPDDPDGNALRSAFKLYGTLDEVADTLIASNAMGLGVFVVVNEGGQTDAEITEIRAIHADFDAPAAVDRLDLADLRAAGIEPHLVVESSAGKFHAYWKVSGLAPSEFEAVQADVIARFGSDKAVKNLSRVMRLAGFVHRKAADATHSGQPFRSRITHRAVRPALTADQAKTKFRRATIRLGDALAAICPAPREATPSFAFSPTQRHGNDAPAVVGADRHADLLQVAARLARQIVFEGLAPESAMTLLRAERDRGRWTRHVPDHEMERALDGAVEKCRNGQWLPSQLAANEQLAFSPESLSEALAREIRPFTDEDFINASKPHPHVFDDGRAGIFPVREVTIIAAPGREGKTYGVVYLASQAVLGRDVAGLPGRRGRAIIYSNEDNRTQYARKLMALGTRMSSHDRSRLREGLLVPDLEVPALVDARQIVTISERRRPVPARMVDALIVALRPLCAGDDRVQLLIFETASTLSDADEDNPGLRTLVAALKRIACELDVAVVLVHHTSQAAAQNLPALNVSIADIRGGTALAYNARQCFLLVNLASEDDCFHEKDNRTRVRRHVAPLSHLRMSALICLDTSKALDPPPIFLSWAMTEFGPAMFEEVPPPDITGAPWRRALATMVAKARAQGDDVKATKASSEVVECVSMATKLAAEGKAPTVRAVSIALGHGADWAQPRLEAGVARGLLTRAKESVPNTKGEFVVYRPKPNVEPVGSDDPPDELLDDLLFSADLSGSYSSADVD